MRFVDEMRTANRDLTTYSPASSSSRQAKRTGRSPTRRRPCWTPSTCAKIDLADRVLVVNPGGYVGESTRREIAHARTAGKPVSFTDPA